MKRFFILAALMLLAGPGLPGVGRAQVSFDPAIAEMISHVSDSTILQSIADLQDFGTRYALASTRDTVARWIRSRFYAAGLTDVVLDSFQYSGVWLENVVATMQGTSGGGGEIVIGAHYDAITSTVNLVPGADDNASGTSAVIEVARVLNAAAYKPASTIRFIAFTAEEQGLQGSFVYAQKALTAGRNIVAMLNFDMIGYRNAAEGDRDVYLVMYKGAEGLAATYYTVMRQYTTLTPVLTTKYGSSSDSYSFSLMGYPSVFCIERDFNPYYHTTSDLVDFIDAEYAGDITRSGLALLLTLEKSTLDVMPVAQNVPADLHLYQNYPNPFNPTTKIQFTIVDRQLTMVNVYDLMAREVARLVNEVKEPGTYTVQFDGLGLASGVYLCRLTDGTAVRTIRMLLVR